mmetsp:Transcript_111659/g.204507  ORF Transcript_111659/g.204507 Transcript_111659/m.204507 type:complete len:603 (-) Transcript_111659:88-1896(-)
MKCLVFCLLVHSSFAACSGNCPHGDDTGLLQFRIATIPHHHHWQTDKPDTEQTKQMRSETDGLGPCSDLQWMACAQPTNVDPTYSGSAFNWPTKFTGDESKVASLLTDVNTVYTNKCAFAAKRTDGSVVTWGTKYCGGDISTSEPLPLTNVVTIVPSIYEFAALKEDGTVQWWGNNRGIQKAPVTNIVKIYSNTVAFAAKDKYDKVTAWGPRFSGGDSNYPSSGTDLTNVDTVFANDYAFAAKKKDGTVACWGSWNKGGQCSNLNLNNVDTIAATDTAFAALTRGGSVVTWGDKKKGGPIGGKNCIGEEICNFDRGWPDCSYNCQTDVSDKLTNVVTIYSNSYSFAARKKDGSIVTWGDKQNVGDPKDLSDVDKVFHTLTAFVGLKKNGNVVDWGSTSCGNGGSDIRTAEGYSAGNKLEGVVDITCGQYACAAIKNDGSVVTWGGQGSRNAGLDSNHVQSQLKNVAKVFATKSAFAALTGEGKVVSWGSEMDDAELSSIQWPKRVDMIIPTGNGFAASYRTASPQMALENCIWKLSSGDQFKISTSAGTLTPVKGWGVGQTFKIYDVTDNSFSISYGYGGGSATYTASAITFKNSQVATKVA